MLLFKIALNLLFSFLTILKIKFFRGPDANLALIFNSDLKKDEDK